MKAHLPNNLEKRARESLKALEILTEVRSNLGDFDALHLIDIMIDVKINLIAQFTPRNAFDYPEDIQLDRLSRLTEVRNKLEGTDYALASLDAVLKSSLDSLIMTTGISRAHSFLTAHLPIRSFRTECFTIVSDSLDSSVELFFDDRTRQIRVHQGGKQTYWEGTKIKVALQTIWKASWAEKSTKVCLYLFDTDALLYASCMIEMKGVGDARGFLQKMSGLANFKM
ncbi:MAG: hypothetical protein Q9213_006595 [Squamulea squamosa]